MNNAFPLRTFALPDTMSKCRERTDALERPSDSGLPCPSPCGRLLAVQTAVLPFCAVKKP